MSNINHHQHAFFKLSERTTQEDLELNSSITSEPLGIELQEQFVLNDENLPQILSFKHSGLLPI